jgi:hypothetical protein
LRVTVTVPPGEGLAAFNLMVMVSALLAFAVPRPRRGPADLGDRGHGAARLTRTLSFSPRATV